jgi:hypothetical protein
MALNEPYTAEIEIHEDPPFSRDDARALLLRAALHAEIMGQREAAAQLRARAEKIGHDKRQRRAR